MSRPHLSDPGIASFRPGNYPVDMSRKPARKAPSKASPIARIGSKHPSRLYIREWMLEKGVDSQGRLAERMDCQPGTVSKLLNGEMEMTTAWLARFADALDMAAPDLFRDPKAPTQAELLSAGTAEELRRAIQLVRLAKTGTEGDR